MDEDFGHASGGSKRVSLACSRAKNVLARAVGLNGIVANPSALNYSEQPKVTIEQGGGISSLQCQGAILWHHSGLQHEHAFCHLIPQNSHIVHRGPEVVIYLELMTQSKELLTTFFSFGAFAALVKAFAGNKFRPNPRGCEPSSGGAGPSCHFLSAAPMGTTSDLATAGSTTKYHDIRT